MTRQEAEERARQLQGEHPERHYVARETAGGDWEVASVELPPELRRVPLELLVPCVPDDPEATGAERRVPGLPGGLG